MLPSGSNSNGIGAGFFGGLESVRKVPVIGSLGGKLQVFE